MRWRSPSSLQVSLLLQLAAMTLPCQLSVLLKSALTASCNELALTALSAVQFGAFTRPQN